MVYLNDQRIEVSCDGLPDPFWCGMLIRGRLAADQHVAMRLDYLKSRAAMNEQLALAREGHWIGPLAGKESYDLKIAATRTEFLHYYTTSPARTVPDPFQLRLWMRASPEGPRVLVDSVKVTLKKIEELWWLGSARGVPNRQMDFVLDDREVLTIAAYPSVQHIAGPLPDPGRSHHVVFVHGYNVNEQDARVTGNEVFRRLFWVGYRGNLEVLTWEGNEGPPWEFATNVENAFQTSPALLEFFDNTLLGTTGDGWNALPDNVTLMAHSLGNQVALDALRLRSAGIGTGPCQLARGFFSVEAAIWPETFWQEEPVAYPESDPPVEYSVGDLKSHSWSFWYNQAAHKAFDSVASSFHTYNPGDEVLALMLLDDYTKRNFGKQYDREGEAGGFGRRLAVEITPQPLPPRRPLVYLPTMFKRGLRYKVGQVLQPPLPPVPPVPWWPGQLNLPLGTEPNPVDGTKNLNAQTVGSPREAHSAFKDEPLPIVWDWWAWLVAQQNGIPRGKE